MIFEKRPFLAVEEVLQLHKDQVYRLIRRMVFDPQAHEELFQEVFLNICESLERFEGRSKLSTWVHTVTVRTCYSYFRRCKQQKNISLDEWEEFPEIAQADQDSPESRMTLTEQAQILDQALDQLPLRYRLAIHLFYVEELQYREIAAILEMPINTVKTNLYRGLRNLREILGGEIDAYL